VWDTETCGIRHPAICQLGYVVVENGVVSEAHEAVLQLPFGVAMETEAQNKHGISSQRCMWEGVPAVVELTKLHGLMKRVRRSGGRCVAHNAPFDVRAFNFTMDTFRCGLRVEKEDCTDTLALSRAFSPLRTVNDRRKAFRLEELYAHLCGTDPSWANLHSALDDVRVTAVCYALGRRRRWWD